jgi:hypothetical protein
LVQNLVLIGQGVFSRRTLENRPFPLKASIAYTTLPCANALACDDFGINRDFNRYFMQRRKYYIEIAVLVPCMIQSRFQYLKIDSRTGFVDFNRDFMYSRTPALKTELQSESINKLTKKPTTT